MNRLALGLKNGNKRKNNASDVYSSRLCSVSLFSDISIGNLMLKPSNILLRWCTIRKPLLLLLRSMKVTNDSGLWDVKLTWYSPSATRRICIYGSEYGFEVYGFKPIWPSLIIEVHANQAKFLNSEDFRTKWVH